MKKIGKVLVGIFFIFLLGSCGSSKTTSNPIDETPFGAAEMYGEPINEEENKYVETTYHDSESRNKILSTIKSDLLKIENITCGDIKNSESVNCDMGSVFLKIYSPYQGNANVGQRSTFCKNKTVDKDSLIIVGEDNWTIVNDRIYLYPQDGKAITELAQKLEEIGIKSKLEKYCPEEK